MTENMTPAQSEPREDTTEAPQTVTLPNSEEVTSEPTQTFSSENSQVWSAQSAASDATTTSDEAHKQIRFLTLIWGLVLAATGLWGILLACGVGISAIAAAATIFAGAGILLLIAALRGIRKPAVVDTAETATVH